MSLSGVKESTWVYDDAVPELKLIVNKFDAYTRSQGDLPDAILIAVAKKHGLKVLTSERYQTTMGTSNPRIPNVCEEFKVPCLNLQEYFRAEGL